MKIMSAETFEKVKLMLAAKKDFFLQEEPGVIWKMKREEYGRWFSWAPMAIKEPTGKKKVTFETTAPVSTSISAQEVRKEIFKKIPELKEGESKESKILCVNTLVTVGDFIPIIQYKK